MGLTDGLINGQPTRHVVVQATLIGIHAILVQQAVIRFNRPDRLIQLLTKLQEDLQPGRHVLVQVDIMLPGAQQTALYVLVA